VEWKPYAQMESKNAFAVLSLGTVLMIGLSCYLEVSSHFSQGWNFWQFSPPYFASSICINQCDTWECNSTRRSGS
jgi:hypothetical protein